MQTANISEPSHHLLGGVAVEVILNAKWNKGYIWRIRDLMYGFRNHNAGMVVSREAQAEVWPDGSRVVRDKAPFFKFRGLKIMPPVFQM